MTEIATVTGIASKAPARLLPGVQGLLDILKVWLLLPLSPGFLLVYLPLLPEVPRGSSPLLLRDPMVPLPP